MENGIETNELALNLLKNRYLAKGIIIGAITVAVGYITRGVVDSIRYKMKYKKQDDLEYGRL